MMIQLATLLVVPCFAYLGELVELDKCFINKVIYSVNSIAFTRRLIEIIFLFMISSTVDGVNSFLNILVYCTLNFDYPLTVSIKF